MLDSDDDDGLNRTHGLFLMCREKMNDNFTVAEIGSFGGVSSEVLALHCKKLYCIDTWEDWSGDGEIFNQMKKFDDMRSLYSHIDKLQMEGKEASKKFNDEFFDLVYIDASHWHKDVVEDIKSWLPKVKRGGYLSGHDYKEGIEVFSAVNDFFGQTHSITIYPDTSWVIRK